VHLCDLWTCLDVLCCTASILHLRLIATGPVTNINYIRTRTGRRIGLMIAAIWIISAAISAPARFWRMRKEPDECRINESPAYTVFSTVGAFYLPMLFMIGIYLRIYHAARKRIRRKAFKPSQPAASARRNCRCDGAAAAAAGGEKIHIRFRPHAGSVQWRRSLSNDKKQQQKQLQQNGRAEAQERITIQSKAAMQRERLEQKRERKAARTLAIITGCFLFCWFPFFVRAIVCPFYSPLCTDLISETGHSLIQWLGYTNSLLNPVIYTIFSPDFRSAFSKILFGRYRRSCYPKVSGFSALTWFQIEFLVTKFLKFTAGNSILKTHVLNFLSRPVHAARAERLAAEVLGTGRLQGSTRVKPHQSHPAVLSRLGKRSSAVMDNIKGGMGLEAGDGRQARHFPTASGHSDWRGHFFISSSASSCGNSRKLALGSADPPRNYRLPWEIAAFEGIDFNSVL
uniref:G_PROTEIN_RECEP_F1_2 domain-containing protein n=1 Tax=Macrostomum lignano TaxID=282301 RepID=A0A1I8JQC7_9PLAT